MNERTFDKSMLDVLCGLAQDAGREIVNVQKTHFATWTKDDDTPLTEADLRAHEMIENGLRSAFPGVPVWSEEGDPLRAAVSEFFLVDPLDGTKEFLSRSGEFTVNIAFVQGGRPVAGVVFIPVSGQLYFAAQASGAFRRDERGEMRLHTAACVAGQPLRIVGSRSHGTPSLSAWLERIAIPHTFITAGSSLKFCRIAEGSADVYPRFGPTSQWDTAAGQAVVECAGGAVLDPRGADLRYGPDRPVLNSSFVALAQRGIELPPFD